MPPELLKYSNGWGHVIMSVVSMAVAVILLLQHDPTLNGVSIGLIVAIQSYWFISSAKHTASPEPAKSTQLQETEKNG